MSPKDFIFLCMFIGILISVWNMRDALAPQYRTGCGECDSHRNFLIKQEKRRQRELQDQLAARYRLNEKGDDDHKPGGWVV